MNSVSLRFLFYLILVTLGCLGVQTIWNMKSEASIKFPDGYLLLGIFALGVAVVHLFLLRSAQGSPSQFVRSFMLATFLKFFVYLSVLIGFFLNSTADKRTIVLHFMFYYAAFTVLEVSHLYSELKRMKP